jgi:hypothetical protein
MKQQPQTIRRPKMKILKMLASISAGMALAATPVAQASDAPGKLTVIHGISGLPAPVDVYANGSFLFSFDFGQAEGPLELTPGNYNLEVKLQGAVVLTATAKVKSGMDYTAVAHFVYTGGDPGIKLSVFDNTITPICSNQSRLTVRHTADAPAVDTVVSRGETDARNFVTMPNLSSAKGGTIQGGALDFKHGDYRARLFVAGTTTQAFDSGPLPLDSGESYIGYAIGSLSAGTFTVYIQAIDLSTISCK